jgi:hypothetical protein
MSVIRDLLDSTKLLLNDSLATTGSNIFVGTQTLSGSIIPAADNIYDLGSPTKQWRDLYLSSASLYIDGTKVISSNTDTLTFTTDTGQSIKLLETGGDDITLQTDTGNIELKGTVEIESGKKITDSAGTMINFGNSIAVTGSIETTGTVDGIDLQAFSSSVAAGLAAAEGGASSWNELSDIPSGILSSSAQIASDISGSFTSISASIASDIAGISTDWESITSKPAGIVSSSSQITITESQISDLTHYTDSDVKTKLNTEGVISGSSQVDYNELTNIPVGIISSSAQIASDISGSTNWTAVSSSILPSDTEVFDLGSSTKRWRDLYLSGSTIDLGGTKITRDSTTGDIEFFDGANNRKSLKVDELTIGSGVNARKIKVANGKVAFTDVADARQDTETSHIVPNTTSIFDIGSPTVKYRHLNLSGDITVDGTVDGINLQAFSSSVATDLANSTADYTQLTNIPAGIVSSSSQIVITESQISDLTKYTDTDTLSYINSIGVVSGSETLHSQIFTSTALVNVSHGFETKDVIVYVYDNNDNLIWPTGIKTTTVNAVDITFNAPRSGRVVVSKGGHFVTGIGETSYVSGSNVIGAVDEVKNNNLSSGSLSFWQGTQAEYDALPSYGDTTIYFVI